MFKLFGKKKLDEDTLLEIEENLIISDIGVSAASLIIKELRKKKFNEEISEENLAQIVKSTLHNNLSEYFHEANLLDKVLKSQRAPFVIMISGVNGSGKTTTVAKLANIFQNNNLSVMLAPCDTFRASAFEQLEQWANRTGSFIYKDPSESNPSTIAYKATEYAKEHKFDVLIIDTAGRLENNPNLMSEIAKVQSTVKKVIISAPHENILVVDSTLGQSLVNQAVGFYKHLSLTGIIATKLDSTSKAGSLINIVKKINCPVYYQCNGEGIEDIHNFNLEKYIDNLVS